MENKHYKKRAGGGVFRFLLYFAVTWCIALCSADTVWGAKTTSSKNSSPAVYECWTEWNSSTGELILKAGLAGSNSTPKTSTDVIWLCNESNSYGNVWQQKKYANRTLIKKFIVDHSYYNYTPTSINRFCNDLPNLEIVDGLQNMDVSQITDFNCMFQGCTKLWMIRGMDQWNVKTVTDMNTMFGNCESLYWVDLTAFNHWEGRGPSANMDNLFYGCSNLRRIFVSDPKLFGSQATSKNNWLYGCSNLDYNELDWVDYPFFQGLTSRGVYCIIRNNEFYIFYGKQAKTGRFSNDFCQYLYWDEIDSKTIANITKVVFMPNEARGNSSNMYSPTSLASWFKDFKNLTSIEGLDYVDFSNLKSVSHMFDGCSKLPNAVAEQVLAKIGKSPATDYSYLFYNCTGLTSILNLYDVNSEDKKCYLLCSKASDLSYMFAGCSNLVQIRFGKKNYSYLSPKNISSMFKGCSNLERIMMYSYTDYFKTGDARWSDMFEGCNKLKGGCGTSVSITYGSMAKVDDINNLYSNEDPYSISGYFSVYEYEVYCAAWPISAPSVSLSPYIYKRTADDPAITLTLDCGTHSNYTFKGIQCFGGSTNYSSGNTITIPKGTCGTVLIRALFSTSMTSDYITVLPEKESYTGSTIPLLVLDSRFGTLKQGVDYTITSIKPYGEIKNAGTYQVTLQGKGSKYHSSKTFSVTVNPISITVTPENAEKIYADPDPVINYTFSPNLIGDDQFAGSLSFDKTQGENVGTYKITIGSLANSNYTISLSDADFVIKTKKLNNPIIKTESSVYPYSGSAIKPNVYVFDGEDVIVPSSEYTVSYRNNTEEGIGSIIITDKPGGNYEVSGTGTFKIVSQDLSYKVTIKYLDFANEPEKVLYVPKNDYLTLPADFLEIGYTLLGIYSDQNCQNSFDIKTTKISSDNIILYAKWQINKHILKFLVDGVEVYNQETAYGTPIVAPEQTAVVGKSFLWDKIIPETMPDEDFTASGSYSNSKHSITYIIDDEIYQQCEFVEFGTPITILGNPANPGYKFSGWTPSTLPATMPDYDITVEGTFTPNKHTVTFVVDGSNIVVETQYGVAISSILPKKPGYKFEANGEYPATVPDQNIFISGEWKETTYFLTYLLNGKEYKKFEMHYGDAITLIAAPTKEGHRFSGWSEAPATMPDNSLTITGRFSAKEYTITFVIDGETYKTVTMYYGDIIIAPSVATKSGYTFSGWDNIPATMPDSDITITGSYTANNTTPVAAIAESETAKVWSYNHTIFIETAPDTKYTIVDLQGRVITTSTTKSTHDEIQINQSGIMIVIIGNQSFKLAL